MLNREGIIFFGGGIGFHWPLRRLIWCPRNCRFQQGLWFDLGYWSKFCSVYIFPSFLLSSVLISSAVILPTLLLLDWNLNPLGVLLHVVGEARMRHHLQRFLALKENMLSNKSRSLATNTHMNKQSTKPKEPTKPNYIFKQLPNLVEKTPSNLPSCEVPRELQEIVMNAECIWAASGLKWKRKRCEMDRNGTSNWYIEMHSSNIMQYLARSWKPKRQGQHRLAAWPI